MKTDKQKEPLVTLKFWSVWNGRDNAEIAKKLVLHAYPKAKFKLIEDDSYLKHNHESIGLYDAPDNLLVKVGDNIVLDRLTSKWLPQTDLDKLVIGLKLAVEF